MGYTITLASTPLRSRMLEPRSFGALRFIPGGGEARFPFSNTLVLEDGARVVIDPGAGSKNLADVIAGGADLLINTHTHGDHVRGNRHFRQAEWWAPRAEAHHFDGFAALGRALGVEAVYGSEENKRFAHYCETGEMTMDHPVQLHPDVRLALSRKPHHFYNDGHRWTIGSSVIEAVHTPGHTGGMMSLLFPNQGVAFVADFDLTAFGPWYGQPESDIEQFLQSAAKLRSFDVDWYVTSHEYGYLPKAAFLAELDRFMAVIEKRHRKIKSLLPMDESELLRRGVIYYPHIIERNAWMYMMGAIMVRKHLAAMGTVG
jgi:hydroxyacylglutathione hydrolase